MVPTFKRRGYPKLAQYGLLTLTVLLSSLQLSGCAFLAAGAQKVAGKDVAASYTGLSNKTVAIVIYADWATSLEYVGARDEIAIFVTARCHELLPTVKLVNAKEIIHWQDDTREWQGMPVKEIGQHFSVDRVLYIELLDYRTREPGAKNLMRGRIHAMCRVYETETPGNTPAWERELDVYWPEVAPQNALQTSDITIRRRVLEAFSDQLVGNFFDRKEYEKSIRETAD